MDFNSALKEEVERNTYLRQLLEEKDNLNAQPVQSVKPAHEFSPTNTQHTQVWLPNPHHLTETLKIIGTSCYFKAPQELLCIADHCRSVNS